jgi:ribonuclease D
LSPIHYIRLAADLSTAIRVLSAAPVIAFDLEFDRDRFSYGFRLCLLQVATPSDCFIIDPLAIKDLQPLYDFFETSTARKLAHCPGEDLRLLHSLQCYPTHLCDTELYAKLLNYEQTSLSNMLLQKCGVALNKRWQTSNWARRPLIDDQIRYAADDVIHLFRLEEALRQEANAKGIQAYIDEEQEVLNQTRYQLESKTDFLKKSDRLYLSPYDQFVLNQLFKLRDQLARRFNKPAHNIMPEALVRDLWAGKVTIKELCASPSIYPALRKPGIQQEWERAWKQIHEAARQQGLSKKRPRREPAPDEPYGYQRRESAETVKKEVFAPIQKWIAERLGEHAMRVVLSSGTVSDIIQGQLKISAIRQSYRRQLIAQAAEALHINVQPWW